MVGADIALEAAVVVGFQNLQNAGLAVAVAVRRLGEVAVREVLHIADVRERNAVAVPAHDGGDVVCGIGVERAGAERQAVVGIVHHLEEAVDALRADQQARQAEDVPGGIVHVNGHFDIALMADGHELFEEVLEVFPELLLGDGLILFKQLIELCHALGLPAREGHMVLFGETHDVVRHLLRVVLDHVLLVEKRRGAVTHGVEHVGTRPVEDGHEVIADDLHTEGGEIADGLDIVVDVLIPGGQADLDVIVDVDGFDHLGIEARGGDLIHDGLDLLRLPDLSRHLVMQRPDNGGHAGDLPDIAQLDVVVALAVPAKAHLHWHNGFLLSFYSSAMPMRSNFSVEMTISKRSLSGFGVLTRMLRSESS